MGLGGFPPNVPHELKFQTLSESDKAIQSYLSANARYQNGVLIMARVNVLLCSLRVINHLFDES